MHALMLAVLLGAATNVTKGPAPKDKPAPKTGSQFVSSTSDKRPLVKNTEDDAAQLVTQGKDARPLVKNKEKPFLEKVQDTLRDAGKRALEEGEKAGKAIDKAIQRRLH